MDHMHGDTVSSMRRGTLLPPTVKLVHNGLVLQTRNTTEEDPFKSHGNGGIVLHGNLILKNYMLIL